MHNYVCLFVLFLAVGASADKHLDECNAEKECYFGELFETIDLSLTPSRNATHGVQMALTRFAPSSKCSNYFAPIIGLKSRLQIRSVAVGPARTRCNAQRMYLPIEIGFCYGAVLIVIYICILINYQ
jgi:hypothetical protein